MCISHLQIASNHRIYALCKVLDVTAVQSSHGDTSIGGHIYVRFIRENLCLWRS